MLKPHKSLSCVYNQVGFCLSRLIFHTSHQSHSKSPNKLQIFQSFQIYLQHTNNLHHAWLRLWMQLCWILQVRQRLQLWQLVLLQFLPCKFVLWNEMGGCVLTVG